MKKTEYQIEVGSLRLSEQFKLDLKAKMLEEYNNAQGVSAAAGEKPEITVSGAKWKNYSKYAAIAACLLLAVSTVSVLSIKGLKTGTPSNDSHSAEDYNQTAENFTDDLATPQEGVPEEAPAPAMYDDPVDDAVDDAVLDESEAEADIDNVAVESADENDTLEYTLGYDEEEAAEESSDVKGMNPVTNPPHEVDQPDSQTVASSLEEDPIPRYSNDISSPQEHTSVDEESECDSYVEIPQNETASAKKDEASGDMTANAESYSVSGSAVDNCIHYPEDAPLNRAKATLNTATDIRKVRHLGVREYFTAGKSVKTGKRTHYTPEISHGRPRVVKSPRRLRRRMPKASC